VFWDSCVFIAWIKDERDKHGADALADIEGMIQAAQANELVIVTSIIARLEVLESDIPAHKRGDYDTLMRNSRRYHHQDLTHPIVETAHFIRDYYKQATRNSDDRTLSVPDSIMLATAIETEASPLYTFDEKGDKKCLGLLQLNGRVADKWDVKIVKPLVKKPPLLEMMEAPQEEDEAANQ
jgi:predicted nucleic acid-binding protein